MFTIKHLVDVLSTTDDFVGTLKALEKLRFSVHYVCDYVNSYVVKYNYGLAHIDPRWLDAKEKQHLKQIIGFRNRCEKVLAKLAKYTTEHIGIATIPHDSDIQFLENAVRKQYQR